MSLTDLKKKDEPKPKPKLSVDEFIDRPNAYAKGKSISESHKAKATHQHTNFKSSTFTLTPANIEQLNQLSKSSGLAKSKLIRIMIENAAKGKQRF